MVQPMWLMNLAVSRQSRRPQLAVDLANFITNPENQLRFAQAARVFIQCACFEAARAGACWGEGRDGLVGAARLMSAETLARARVLVPADPGIKRLQAIV